MENEEMEVDALSQEEQVDSEETTEEPEESLEDLKAKLAKAEEVAKNQKIRAEKAEKLAKEKEVKVESEDLTSTDILAIARANINDEDLDYIKKYSKLEGVSISEALKNDVLQEILKTKEEKRKSAEATNVTVSKRGSSKLSDEAIIDNAIAGKLPDDPAELAAARIRMKRGK